MQMLYHVTVIHIYVYTMNACYRKSKVEYIICAHNKLYVKNITLLKTSELRIVLEKIAY